MSSMFWGLTMKPNRKYTQTIVKSFHISGAAIDEGEGAKLYVTADKTKFTVATLSKNVPQFPLDLNFCKGDKIMFQTTGDAIVSLIGYLHDADESDDEDYEDEEYEALAQSLGKQKAGGKAAKDDADSEEESDDDEEDLDDNKLAAEYSSFLEEESGDEEEEDDEDEVEGSGEEEEDDSEEEEDESPKAKKAKISENAKKLGKAENGVAKNDQKQQQQQQAKNKKDKKAAGGATAVEPKAKEQQKSKEGKQPAGERSITGGVKVQDVNPGNGPEAKQGKRVSVYYIGRLKSNNKTFDSMQKGNGFKFALGAGEVIKGWDVGVVGMKVGGKRRITCPPHMAYGARGHPPTIPPNSTLVFDVELKAVH